MGANKHVRDSSFMTLLVKVGISSGCNILASSEFEKIEIREYHKKQGTARVEMEVLGQGLGFHGRWSQAKDFNSALELTLG